VGVETQQNIERNRRDDHLVDAYAENARTELSAALEVIGSLAVRRKQTPNAKKQYVCKGCACLSIGKFRWKSGCCPQCWDIFRSPPQSHLMQRIVDSGFSPGVPHVGHITGLSLNSRPKNKERREGSECLDIAFDRPTGTELTFLVNHGLESRTQRGGEVLHRSPELATIGFAIAVPTVFAKTPHNLSTAVKNRLCGKPDGYQNTGKPKPGFWELSTRILKERPDLVNLVFRGFMDHHRGEEKVCAITFSEWVANFPKSRQREFRDARRVFLAGGDTSRKFKQLLKYDVFVKRELMNLSDKYIVPDGVPVSATTPCANPRSICNQIATAHVLMGPWFRPITHRVKQMLCDCVYYASRSPECNNEWVSSLWPKTGHTYHPILDYGYSDYMNVMTPGKSYVKLSPEPCHRSIGFFRRSARRLILCRV